ncbi:MULTISPECIES: type II restriction endonuclease [Pseudomonas]|uniref:type II restriction endonuclease n=1 Tax=Pseudomonas TaxID=286 RepID=UPI00041BFADD|nr:MULTISPECIES: type II restriction endonuclease [Pseudomonas]MBH3396418.1 restriction endonuclease [Pseudomonas monteilii]MCJ7850766.1 restriction endonuclease [Pseudomonas monteilii]SNB64439.1 EcoRII C terminal [Pseudomonas sp. URIL14HWK12:I8]
MGTLRQQFTGVAAKYLSAVDATPRSHQHEIGSNAFVQILSNPGAQKIAYEGAFLYFDDESDIPLKASGVLTWYDTRLRQVHRKPEYRLYYRENVVTNRMSEGDFCVIAVRPDNTLMLVICPRGSTSEQQIRWLFDIDRLPIKGFEVHQVEAGRRISIIETMILEELGIEVRNDNSDWLGKIIDRFGERFPVTAEFSSFVRETCRLAEPIQTDPDTALLAWMEHEEMLFRTLERKIVQAQLDKGFSDVEQFIRFSLSVQNRRKSRVGHALEHHLAAVFEAHGLPFGRQVVTENRATADFLFPGQKQYSDLNYPDDQLVMLASKSTCKDRWRQVLAEACRIKEKHLFTLEPAISLNQTNEMKAHNLQLVVPSALIGTYSGDQQEWLLNLAAYLERVKNVVS